MCLFEMIIKYHKKITEADEIQNGNQSTSDDVQNSNSAQQNTVDLTDTQKKLADLTARKQQLKTQYGTDIKTINDQITVIQQQRSDLDTSPTENDDQAAAKATKVVQLNSQLNDLANKKLLRKISYQNDVNNVEKQMVVLNQVLADNGQNVDTKYIDESKKERLIFSRKLYEAVTNRTDEMYAAITMAFDKIENLTYTPDKTQCKTFARNVIAFLNRIGWNKPGILDKFKTFIYGVLNASHISFSNNEKNEFVNNLIDIMKDNTLFSWVIGEYKEENK